MDMQHVFLIILVVVFGGAIVGSLYLLWDRPGALPEEKQKEEANDDEDERLIKHE